MLMLYNAAAFNGAAFAGELSKMEKFLKRPSKRTAQPASDLLTAMRAIAAKQSGKPTAKVEA